MYKLIQKKRQQHKSNAKSKSCPHRAQNLSEGQVQPDAKELQDVTAATAAGTSDDINTATTNDPSTTEMKTSDLPDDCPQCKEEKRKRRIYRWKMICALLIPQLLSALDLTVVATASPFVASYFDKVNQVNWVATAYTLCNTAFIPTFGQLSDIFGRHSVMQLAMLLMLIGSVLCATAQAWGMFLLGRGIQGVASAGIMNLIKIVLSDKVSLEENAKNNTIFALVSGTSFSVGPIIGGYLTNSNWRYCFVLPIPLSVIGSILLFLLIRKELVRGSARTVSLRNTPGALKSALATIDIGGTLLFIFGVGLILLGTSWGGSTYAWNTAAVLVPLVVGSVLFVSFFFHEYLLENGRLLNRKFPKQTPLMPWSLFERIDSFVLAFINFATGAAMYSLFYFMGLYFTVAQGLPPSKAGVYLLLYIPGLGGGVYLAMFACNVWPRQTFYPLLFGSIVECAGIAGLTYAVTTSRIPLVNGMMALAGVGSGVRFMPGSLHGVGIWPNRIASVLSLMAFAQPFGGTIALAIMGSVFNNKFTKYLTLLRTDHQSYHFNQPGTSSIGNFTGFNRLPLHFRHYYGGRAVMWSFISIMPLMGLCVLLALCLGNVWIKKGNARSGEVIYSSFLLACMTGTLRSKKVSNVEPSDRAEHQNEKDRDREVAKTEP